MKKFLFAFVLSAFATAAGFIKFLLQKDSVSCRMEMPFDIFSFSGILNPGILKKRFFCTVFSGGVFNFCFFCGFSFDFGGIFINASEFPFRNRRSYLNQTDSVTLWGKFGNSSLSFGMEGFYDFKFLGGNIFHNLGLNLARFNIKSADSGFLT